MNSPLNRSSAPEEKACRVILLLYGLMMCAVTALLVFAADAVDYGGKELTGPFLPGAILLCGGVVFLAGLRAVSGTLKRIPRRGVYAFLILLPFLQFGAVLQYFFLTDWDVSAVTTFSDVMAHGGEMEELIPYFSAHPNNLFLVRIYSWIMRLGHLAGLHPYERQIILMLQCALNAGTGFLLYQTLLRRRGEDEAIFGLMIYLCLIAISPWTSIPYSDAMGLPFPMLLVFLFTGGGAKGKAAYRKWALIGLVTVIGYQIKPHIVFVTAAMAAVRAIRGLSAGGKTQVLSMLRKAAVMGAAMALGWLGTNLAVSSLRLSLDPEQAFGVPHYFMMGVNQADQGLWSEEDVKYSAGIATREERNRNNLEIGLERIRGMGFSGAADLMMRKTLSNFNDGTFGWGGEGAFYKRLTPADNVLSRFWRGLYYNRSQEATGIYYRVWANFAQMLWLTMLLMGILSAFLTRDEVSCVIALSLMMLTGFELVFEARSRYFYIFSPLYLILGTDGFHDLCFRLRRRMNRTRGEETQREENRKN